MLVVGSVNRDYVCRVEALPAPGQTVLGGEASVGSGGKGGNQAVAASLLGARTALVARVGDDSDGRALAADLAEAGVDVRAVTATDARTGMAFVLVDARGENSIVVAPGANELLDPAAVAHAVRERLSASGVLVTQAEIPVPAFDAAVLTAAEVGCRAVVNLAPYRPVDGAVLALCDPLVVNESEASDLLGREVRRAARARERRLTYSASVAPSSSPSAGRGPWWRLPAAWRTSRPSRWTWWTRRVRATRSPGRWPRRSARATTCSPRCGSPYAQAPTP